MSAEIIWKYFKNNGLNDYGCAGLMGNLYAESLLIPTNMENYYESRLGYNDTTYTQAVDNGLYTNFVKDCVGYGLAQWTYWTRKQGLLAFAKSKNVSIGDLNMQLEYLMKELREEYPGVLNILKNATTITEASNAVLMQFERPADQSASVQKQRADFGQNYYKKFAKQVSISQSIQDPVAKVIQIARAEIGYIEKASNANLDDKTANAGKNNYTKYARDLDALGVYNFGKNGYEWCDIFADWVYVQAFGVDTALAMTGQVKGGLGAGCKFSAQYYQSMGRYFKSGPKAGDQIFYIYDGDINHTGIVEKVEGNYVHTIEGNTTTSSNVVPNGGGVNARKVSLSDPTIAGYGRPNWDLVAYTQATTIPTPQEAPAVSVSVSTQTQTVAKDSVNLTSDEFVKQMQLYRATLQDNDASSWSAEARQWAIDNGIVVGGNDKSFNGMWQDFLSREQMIVMLHRFAKVVGKA